MSAVSSAARQVGEVTLTSLPDAVGLLATCDDAYPDVPIERLYDPETVSFLPNQDADEAAESFGRYNLVSSPVLDANRRVLGRVTVDAVLEYVRERKAQLDVDRARVAPAYIGIVPEDTGPGDRFSSATFEPTTPDELRGTGASAGVVRGPALVVLSQDEFGKVRPGDIVVCPASNPTWVPVFTIAGGLVTNTGGVLSHAAVVAREFGIPAVVGTTNGGERIKTGDRVRVNGSTGVVEILA